MVKMKVDILAIGVHPDDVELSCSGTLLKHIDIGYSVAIVDLTQGELGSRGSAELRLREANDAKKYMGIEHRDNLSMEDGFFSYNKESLLKIVQSIRKFKPQIVLANAISDRHPDHGKAAKLISDACFLSGLIKIKSVYDDLTQEHWRPEVVYHYIQDHNLKPDFIIDISGYEERKMEAIKCFSSQFYDPNSTEPSTPISSKNFLDYISSRSATFGRHIGVAHGEGFNVARPVGVKNIFDLI